MIRLDMEKLSISRQCRLLGLRRSTYYYRHVAEDPYNLELMRLIDEAFLEAPFFGTRQMTRHLVNLGHAVGRRRVRRLMRIMGLRTIYQRPRTTIPHPEHKIYPYMLRDLEITRPNHVWCADITYIPMQRGFLYLVAIMDWHSRAVLSWKLSNTMDVSFCIDALEEALHKYGAPEIFNTDQGSQFTSIAFTQRLKEAEVAISMDGKGRWIDNVFIERLWRSLKYECVYLRELATGSQARQALGDWFAFYNHRRPHSVFDGRRPMEVYVSGRPGGEAHAPHQLAPLETAPQDTASGDAA